MKIIVKNNNSERQSPEVTIDTSTCHYPYAIREALQLALELDGCDKETIKNVFNLQEDEKTLPMDAGWQAEPAQEKTEQMDEFLHTPEGYENAVAFLINTNKYLDLTYRTNISESDLIRKANELWKQQNNK